MTRLYIPQLNSTLFSFIIIFTILLDILGTSNDNVACATIIKNIWISEIALYIDIECHRWRVCSNVGESSNGNGTIVRSYQFIKF